MDQDRGITFQWAMGGNLIWGFQFSPDDIQIDILPFGEIEIDDEVGFEGEGLSSIKVNGFREVYEEGTEKLVIETGHQFKVATLPAIILLKLIAYDDRPEKRHKDPRDIANIIQHYFSLESDTIYDHHSDLFGEDKEEKSLESVSAEAIGREIRKIIHENNRLLERVRGIVEREMTLVENSGFVRQMVMESDRRVREVNEVVRWLRDLLNGLQK